MLFIFTIKYLKSVFNTAFLFLATIGFFTLFGNDQSAQTINKISSFVKTNSSQITKNLKGIPGFINERLKNLYINSNCVGNGSNGTEEPCRDVEANGEDKVEN